MLVVAVIAFTGSGSVPLETPAGSDALSGAVNVKPAGLTAAPDSCLSAQSAIRFYAGKTRELVSTFSRRMPDRIPWPTCYLARRAAREWRARARAAAERYAYHYAWEIWLPANWIALGSCETGYGGAPNFEHSNGSYTSAFGISWAEYDADAAYNGAPPWRVRHTPRDQYLAATGHLARFGDGWGCPGP